MKIYLGFNLCDYAYLNRFPLYSFHQIHNYNWKKSELKLSQTEFSVQIIWFWCEHLVHKGSLWLYSFGWVIYISNLENLKLSRKHSKLESSFWSSNWKFFSNFMLTKNIFDKTCILMKLNFSCWPWSLRINMLEHKKVLEFLVKKKVLGYLILVHQKEKVLKSP